MKKTKERHLNNRHKRQYGAWISCLKRTCVLCLSMIVLITSDSRMMDVFTVRAEDENHLKCIITSFSTLPDEVVEQTVCTGTSLEELYFPDTLEVVCTYENGQENSSDIKDQKPGEDDKATENPDESDETLDKPNEEDKVPEESDQDDAAADQSSEDNKESDIPEQSDKAPAQPDVDDQAPEEPDQGDKAPAQPDVDDKAPEEPDQGDKVPAQPDVDDQASEEPDQGDKVPAQPDVDDQASEEPDQSDNVSSKPGGDDKASKELDQSNKAALPDENNKTSENLIQGDTPVQPDEGSITSDELNNVVETIGSATVYSDRLDEMILAAREKMLSFFSSPIIEETQVFVSANLSESDAESGVQVLTNTVNINPVSWECIFEYDGETPGFYIFTPLLPEGYILSDGVLLPEILVIVVDSEEKPVMAKNKVLSTREGVANSGSFGNGLTWTYDNGTLTISGTGTMDSFDKEGTPWDYYEDMIKTVKIESGVTNIGSYAFFDCTLLSSVEIPGTVTAIETSAFHGCSALKSVTIPSGVKSIGNLAFYGCVSLDSLTISNTVTSIGNLAFNGCSSLTTIEIPDSVETVTAYAFRNCSGAFLYYPASLPELGTVKETQANIKYAFPNGDDQVELEIVRLNSDIGAIRFPEKVGNGTVWAANWEDYPAVAITHVSYPEHRYVDGTCAICGCQTEPQITIDYVNELLIGFDKGMTYIIDGTNYYFDTDNDAVLNIDDYNWFGQTISIAKQSINQTAGKAQQLVIPDRPAPPEGVDKEDVRSKGGSGKLINVNATMEYQKEDASKWEHVKGTTVENLSPGTYYVRIAAVAETSDRQGSFCSLPVTVTIEEYELVQETMPKAEIDYVEETLTGLTGSGDYHIGAIGTTGADMTALANGTIKLSTDWFGQTLAIVKKGDGTDTKDSEEQHLKIPGRPKAPANTGKTDVTAGNNDGTLTGVSSAMVYRMEGSDKWLEITGSTVNNLAPGRYEIRYKAKPEEQKFASEIVVQIIASANMSQETIPIARIDYKEEKLIGLKADEWYLIDGVSMTAEEGGSIDLEEGWLDSTISIVKEGDYITTSDSEEQLLKIPARPAPPTGVKATPVSAIGVSDGKLINVDSTMEYLSEDAEKGISITGKQVTGLSPGIYIVYFKATQTSFCSEGVEMVVQDAELKIEAKPAAKIDYVNEKLTGLKAGAAYVISDYDTESIFGDLVYAGKDGSVEIEEAWMGNYFNIVKIGDEIYTQDSEAQALQIPERPSAPEDIISIDESKQGAKDGKLTNVKNTMEYQKEDAATWKAISGTVVNGLSSGAYLVRYKAVKGENGSFCSESVRCTITAFELLPESVPDPEISYYDECFMYLEPGAYYKINGKKVQADDNGEIPIQSAWMQGKAVPVIRLGDGLTTSDSPKLNINVPKRRPAPKGIKTVSESEKDMHDGKLVNVSSEMEYRRMDSDQWIQIDSDTVEELEAGKYAVRYAYTTDDFASSAVTKTVYAYGEEPQEQEDEEELSNQINSSEQNQDSTGDQSGSSQSGKAAVSPLGKNTSADVSDKDDLNSDDTSVKPSEQNNGGRGGSVNTQNKQNKTDIEDSAGEDTKENADISVSGNEVWQSKDGAEAEMQDQHSSANAYTSEYTTDKMSEFYDFILRLADSRNLIWIAVILAEPIIFLLILIYLLNLYRKKRDEECQIEN